MGAFASLGPVQDRNLTRGSASDLMGRGELLGPASWLLGAFLIGWLVFANCRLSLRGIRMRRAARSFWAVAYWCITSITLWPPGLLLRCSDSEL